MKVKFSIYIQNMYAIYKNSALTMKNSFRNGDSPVK